jgi:hypothetical protein
MKPISNASGIVTVILCITMSFLSLAQEGPPASFVVEDLQLISLASIPDWDNDWEWSRAVETATILAWLHDQGYVLLLDDLNEDGVIDELDTIELADRLGKHPMDCEESRRSTDAWLLVGLAEYVADKYPDIFELKIYDRGFPAEFERKMGRPFTPDAIPGIILTLESEPTFDAYMKELVEEEGVILGLEEEPGRNLYFTGRSFLRDPIAPNIHGIDLVWAEEDWYEAGMQGKVLETRARQTDAFYVDYQGGWMKVESMLALSPLYPPGEGPAEACPDLIVVGSAVCECSAPCKITVDATVYNIGAGEVPGPFTVSLVDIACGPHAECPYNVVISGGDLDQLNATGSVHISFPAFGIPVPTWPCPSCTFTLVVDSKSDIDESCYPAPMGEYNNVSPLDVCCDGEAELCPDLVVRGTPDCRCVETPGGIICYVHIEARVTNIAHPVPVPGPFAVSMSYGCFNDGMGTDSVTVSGVKLSQLNSTGSTTVDFFYDFVPDPTSPCCRYGLYVDSGHSVDESCYPMPDGEHNNVFIGEHCCKLPPQEGRCPDLSVRGDPSCYCYVNDRGDTVCNVQVIATVGKAGGDVGSPFEVKLTSNCNGTPGFYNKAFPVTPGQINPDGIEQILFSYSFIPDDPMNPCCSITLQVDGPDVIDETCFLAPFGEANNEWGPYGFCCPGVEERCPDLVVAGSAVCECGSDLAGVPAASGVCIVTVEGVITNIGTAPIGSTFRVHMNYNCGEGWSGAVTTVSPTEINPTGSATVVFSFPFTPTGPGENCCEYSISVDTNYDIDECEPLGELNNYAAGIVCCDVPPEECVDLTISGVAHCICGYDLPNFASGIVYGCRVTVDATVNKSGPGEVPTIFSIKISDVACNGSTGIIGQRPLTPSQLTELNTTGSVTIPSAFSWDIPWPPGEGAPCCSYTLTVDSLGVIDECPEGAEDNNTFIGRFCCEEIPVCPDIVIEITRTSCNCERVPIRVWHSGDPAGGQGWWETIGYETTCEVTVYFTVKNIGTQDAGAFHVKLETDTGHTDTKYLSGLLIDEEKYRQFDFTTDAPGSVTVTLIADNDEEVDECDEDNNTDSASIGCK